MCILYRCTRALNLTIRPEIEKFVVILPGINKAQIDANQPLYIYRFAFNNNVTSKFVYIFFTILDFIGIKWLC